MLRREQLIGIVSSRDIRRRERGGLITLLASGVETEGYTLLVTDSRLLGARRSDYPEDFCAYLGPGSTTNDEMRTQAEKKASEIISVNDLEMQRDKVVRIVYDAPGVLTGGRLLVKEVGRRIELKITVTSPWNGRILPELDVLVRSLLAFAPDRMYSEKTGSRIEASTLFEPIVQSS